MFTCGIEWRSASTTLRPLLSVARDTVGNRASGGVPAAGTLDRSTALAVVPNSGYGCTSSTHCPSLSQRAAAERRSAAVDLVAREHVGLAAESADALDAAHEVGAPLRLDAAQLARGRAGLDEARQLLIDRPLHLREIAARLRGRANHQLAADLPQVHVGDHVGRDLLV